MLKLIPRHRKHLSTAECSSNHRVFECLWPRPPSATRKKPNEPPTSSLIGQSDRRRPTKSQQSRFQRQRGFTIQEPIFRFSKNPPFIYFLQALIACSRQPKIWHSSKIKSFWSCKSNSVWRNMNFGSDLQSIHQTQRLDANCGFPQSSCCVCCCRFSGGKREKNHAASWTLQPRPDVSSAWQRASVWSRRPRRPRRPRPQCERVALSVFVCLQSEQKH